MGILIALILPPSKRHAVAAFANPSAVSGLLVTREVAQEAEAGCHGGQGRAAVAKGACSYPRGAVGPVGGALPASKTGAGSAARGPGAAGGNACGTTCVSLDSRDPRAGLPAGAAIPGAELDLNPAPRPKRAGAVRAGAAQVEGEGQQRAAMLSLE